MSLDGYLEPHLSKLPPGVREETYTYSNGKTSTIYKAPVPEDGPYFRRDKVGNRRLVYMYANWFFIWGEGQRVVDIWHGECESGRKPDYSSVHIGDCRFNPEQLCAFARRWRKELMQRCSS